MAGTVQSLDRKRKNVNYKNTKWNRLYIFVNLYSDLLIRYMCWFVYFLYAINILRS